ncbi:M24 family metallopeptidase [Brevibacillus sp. VP]|uniref:M24 family metallopeptidase n=1 Tax=unclassified Brevibacillus TaxID=2684853 RepID=UPI000E2EB20A|nr:Xaa-Pro peptidase family protein [Brevibacillus sp. VP]RFB38738.1 aminopeptidase P family protein [Brevibacillus sp. VP]
MDQRRLTQLRSFMEEQQTEAILVTLPMHVYYLTGFFTDPHERFMGLVIPADGEPVLIVPGLDRNAAEAASSVQKIMTHTDTDNPYQILKQALPQNIKRLAVEKSHLTVSIYEAMVKELDVPTYIDVEEPLRQMRLIKSVDEVARIKRACETIEEVLRQCLPKVKVGVTEAEIVAELEFLMKKLGSQGPSFSTMVLSGPNSALPHGKPGSRKIANGEFLLFDMGVLQDGYISDITRTFAVGEINDKQKEVYQTVLAANLAAIEATRPGVVLADLDQVARQVIADKGYGEYFTHRLGHGMGMDVHEYPSVHGANKDKLVSGMTFTIEPGIYLPEVGGVRIEDDVLVTDTGVEILTSYPKELQIIGV